MVLLAYYSGLSREQLADQFDVPVNTVKTWLRRCSSKYGSVWDAEHDRNLSDRPDGYRCRRIMST